MWKLLQCISKYWTPCLPKWPERRIEKEEYRGNRTNCNFRASHDQSDLSDSGEECNQLPHYFFKEENEIPEFRRWVFFQFWRKEKSFTSSCWSRKRVHASWSKELLFCALNFLRPIYTMRLWRMQQAYDRPTTWFRTIYTRTTFSLTILNMQKFAPGFTERKSKETGTKYFSCPALWKSFLTKCFSL